MRQERQRRSKRKRQKEGRLAKHRRLAGEIRENPRVVGPLVRAVLLDVWRARGGGFYGLGYIVAFTYFEIMLLTGELVGSESVGEFALTQVLEYFLRFGLMSFVNVFRALLWPFYILEQYAGTGLVVLIVGYFGFEYLLRPRLDNLFPELAGQKAGSGRDSGNEKGDGSSDGTGGESESKVYKKKDHSDTDDKISDELL